MCYTIPLGMLFKPATHTRWAGNQLAHRIGPACFVKPRLNSELPLAQMYLMRRSVCTRQPLDVLGSQLECTKVKHNLRHTCRGASELCVRRKRAPSAQKISCGSKSASYTSTFCFTMGDLWPRRLSARSTKPADTSGPDVCTSSQISSSRYTAQGHALLEQRTRFSSPLYKKPQNERRHSRCSGTRITWRNRIFRGGGLL